MFTTETQNWHKQLPTDISRISDSEITSIFMLSYGQRHCQRRLPLSAGDSKWDKLHQSQARFVMARVCMRAPELTVPRFWPRWFVVGEATQCKAPKPLNLTTFCRQFLNMFAISSRMSLFHKLLFQRCDSTNKQWKEWCGHLRHSSVCIVPW